MGQSGPWGPCRLLVVDSLPWTAIEHYIINFWTKKKRKKSEFLKNIITISFSYLSFPLFLPLFKLSFLFDHLPSAYLFSAQLWSISEILFLLFIITFVLWSNLFDPHHHIYVLEVLSQVIRRKNIDSIELRLRQLDWAGYCNMSWALPV